MITKMIVVGALLCGLCVNASAQESVPNETPRSISVHGVGTVMAAPDQVRLSVQVNTRAETASEAMAEASKRTRNVLALLKEYGIEDKDIQTSRITVTAILDYEKRVQPPPIVGYTGTNEFSMLFKEKKMDKVGEFMDRAVSAGATSFGSLQFEASTERVLERDALKKAAGDAQARAEVLAKELGAKIGRVLNASESISSPGPITMRAGFAAADMSSASAPVQSGELTIKAQVNVTFELK